MYDTGELLETSKSLYHLLDGAGGKPLDDRAKYWPTAIWVHEATTRAEGKHWLSLLPRFRKSCVGSMEWDTVRPMLETVRDRLPHTGKKPGAVKRALASLDLLMTDEYQGVREILRRDYETHALLDARKYIAGK